MGYSNHLPDKMKLQEVNRPCISGYLKQLGPIGPSVCYGIQQPFTRAISVKVCPILLLGMTDIAQFL